MARNLIPAAPALAIAIGLLLLAFPAAAQVPAPVPVHNVGEEVGFGATIDLGALAARFLDLLRAQDQMDPNITIHELNFTGSMDLWVYMVVIEETTTYYTIREDSVAGVRAHFILDLTSTQLPRPGVYPGTLDPLDNCIPSTPIEMATRRLSVDVQIAFLESATETSKWNVSDFALRETTTNATVDLRITMALRGIPSSNVTASGTACQLTIAYEDEDLTITADVDTQIRAIYSPALDIFDFPINHLETWWANSTAAVGGRISGTIDVVGLNATEEKEFFDALNASLAASGYTVTGLTGFPIVLQDIMVTFFAVTYLENGDIRNFPAPVSMNLQARASQVILADDQLHDVYLLSPPPVAPGLPLPACSWVYSPERGFIVGYLCEFVPGVPYFALDNVPTGQARQEIDQTKVEYAVTQPAGNPLADFFLKFPYIGLFLIVAAVVVIAALLSRRRRRPAPMVPPATMGVPSTPPEAPPPESPSAPEEL